MVHRVLLIISHTLTLFSIITIPGPLSICRAMAALEDRALVPAVLMKILHLVPRVTLRLLNTTPEDKDLLLLRGKLMLLIAERGFYSLEYFDVVLAHGQWMRQIHKASDGG